MREKECERKKMGGIKSSMSFVVNSEATEMAGGEARVRKRLPRRSQVEIKRSSTRSSSSFTASQDKRIQKKDKELIQEFKI